MADLYPEPPHLSVFVSAGLSERTALRRVAGVLMDENCVFTGDVLLARGKTRFRQVSDLEREVVKVDAGVIELLGESSDPPARTLLRLGFRHRRLGTLSLGLSAAGQPTERHPIEVACHGGPFGLPSEAWSKEDRRDAKWMLGWARRVMLAAASATEARYGAIGVESVLPTPSMLKDRSEQFEIMPFIWFLSQETAEAGALVADGRSMDVEPVEKGSLVRTWRALDGQDADDAQTRLVLDVLRRAVPAA